jgi:hypothetical protein
MQLGETIPNSTMDQFVIGNGFVIPNVSIALLLHDSLYGTLPDGTTYSTLLKLDH